MNSPGIMNFYGPLLEHPYYFTNVHLSSELDTNISTVAGPQSPGYKIISDIKHNAPPLNVKSIYGVSA
jgi:hypothetical protein